MRSRSPIRLLLMLVLSALLLSACSGEQSRMKKAAGTYEGLYTKMVGSDEKEKESFSLILKADGTGLHMRNDSEYSITWTLDGARFTMKETFLGLSIDYTGTLKGDALSIFNGDPESSWTYEYVYKKQ